MNNFLKKFYYKLVPTTQERVIKKLRRGGAKIGHHVKLFGPETQVIDSTRPWLLEIGSYTKITQGCVILTHDYSLSVLRRVYGEWIGEGKKTYIGDNCFIGINSIILMGTHIGNNVIVGAGSVVHGDIPDNVVIAGNPAKVICTLEEHYKNRKNKTLNEAKFCLNEYYKIFQRVPKQKDLVNFKFLFTPRDLNVHDSYGYTFNASGDEPEDIKKAFLNSKPIYNDFYDFVLKELKKE